MKNFLLGCSIILLGILTSCERSIPEPKKEETDSVKVPIDTLIKPIDSLKMGLLLYLPFNNSGNDESGNHNDGTKFNISSTRDRNGIKNSAYYFNGENSYIVIDDNQVLRLNNTDFTINLWVNLDEYYPLSGTAILSKNLGAYQNGWNCSVTGLTHVWGKPGRAFYNVSGGTDPSAMGEKIIELGKWAMMTTVYSLVDQKISFYINGELDKVIENMPTPNPATTADLYLGKNSYASLGGSAPTYLLKGKLDDIRIYKRKLNMNLIHKLYTLPN